MVVTFASLAPIVIDGFGVAQILVWRCSGWIAAFFAGATAVDIARRQMQMSRQELIDAGILNHVISWALGVIAALLLVPLLFGPGDPAFYVASLCFSLLVGAANFVTFTLHRIL